MAEVQIDGAFLDSLTIDDIDAIETITEAPIDDLLSGNVSKGKLMRAIAYVIRRRQDPSVTPEHVGTMSVGEFEKLLGSAVAPSPPVNAAG